MHITNMGKGSRVLPLKNGKQIEIAPGQTVDFPDDEWAALAKRATVNADIEAGQIAVGGYVIRGADVPGVVVTSATVTDAGIGAVGLTVSTDAAGKVAVEPKRRGRPPKFKPDGDTSGEDA